MARDKAQDKAHGERGAGAARCHRIGGFGAVSTANLQ